MPVQDTIKILSDSAQLVLDSLQRRDSVLLADSVAKADSIARADSIALHAFKGFDGVLPQGAPADQNWVFLMLFFMFGIVVFSFIRAITPPINIVTSFFTSKERSSIFNKTSIDNLEQKFYFFVFSVTSISLLAYLIFYQQGRVFDFWIYCQFVAVTLIFFLVKYIFAKLIAYIFLDSNVVKTVMDSYLNVISFVSVLFYPLLLIYLYGEGVTVETTSLVALIIIVLGLLLFTIKLVQIFLHKVVVSLYLLLYLCTLEILPVIIVIQVFRYLAKYV